MSVFNSDVLDRLAVAIDLANAAAEGTLPGDVGRRPSWIFESRRYQAPSGSGDWTDLAAMAAQVTDLLRLIIAGDHDAAVGQVNDRLQDHQTVPFVERHGECWALHFHSPQATFAQGWAGGVAAALAVSYSTTDVSRIGSCAGTACSRLFLDRGRNQQRRFCCLRCQNRAKAADHRRRHPTGLVRSGDDDASGGSC